MQLKWTRGDCGDIDLLNCGKLAGWVQGREGYYDVCVSVNLAVELMPCEDRTFVTLRPAMRALKETVVVLLIGRAS